MSAELIPAPAPNTAPALFTPTPKAAKRVLEFFTAQINNDHTRKAYLNATRRFELGATRAALASSPTWRPSTSPLSSRSCRGNSQRRQESEAAWRELVQSLVARHLGTPALAVIDGNPSLQAALRAQWPQIAIQRCTNHKLRNLLAKAPAHLREEVAEDYRRMVYADSREAVEHARAAFLRKWRLRCKAVVSSLEEAGDELFTFLQFPKSPWKALRTTNALERINGEFRRRTKTQASLPGEDAVLLLLSGLLRSGQIVLRRIDGRHQMPKPKTHAQAA